MTMPDKMPTSVSECLDVWEHAMGSDFRAKLPLMIPSHMVEGIAAWIALGRKPGDFLTAVLSNDLMGAMGRADDWNKHAMFGWCQLLYNHCPHNCYGNPDVVQEWARCGGLWGRHQAALKVKEAADV